MSLSNPKVSNSTDHLNSYSDEELRQFVGYQLKRTFNAMKSDLSKVLEPVGLRMTTYSALVLIEANPGIRQSELSQILSMERPNMVLVLDDLEQRGWITRERLETDRRAYALKVTLSGKRVCEQAKTGNMSAEEKRLDNLEANERRVLVSALSKLERGEGN